MGSKCGYIKPGEKIPIFENSNIPPELSPFIKKWSEKAEECKDFSCDWYVKYAGIVFRIGDIQYDLSPGAINASSELFEHFSSDMENDLVALGAEDVFYTGMLD